MPNGYPIRPPAGPGPEREAEKAAERALLSATEAAVVKGVERAEGERLILDAQRRGSISAQEAAGLRSILEAGQIDAVRLALREVSLSPGVFQRAVERMGPGRFVPNTRMARMVKIASSPSTPEQIGASLAAEGFTAAEVSAAGWPGIASTMRRPAAAAPIWNAEVGGPESALTSTGDLIEVFPQTTGGWFWRVRTMPGRPRVGPTIEGTAPTLDEAKRTAEATSTGRTFTEPGRAAVPRPFIGPPAPPPAMGPIERTARQGGPTPQIPAGTMFGPPAPPAVVAPPNPLMSPEDLRAVEAGMRWEVFDQSGGAVVARFRTEAEAKKAADQLGSRYDYEEIGKSRLGPYPYRPAVVAPQAAAPNPFGKAPAGASEGGKWSPGHIKWLESGNELFRDGAGEWYMASPSNVFDVRTGYRIGRWLAPAHFTEAQVANLVGEAVPVVPR